jgi:hypothetical protein
MKFYIEDFDKKRAQCVQNIKNKALHYLPGTLRQGKSKFLVFHTQSALISHEQTVRDKISFSLVI